MAEQRVLSKVKSSPLLLPALIVLVGAAIRLIGLPHVGCLSFDEAWSARIAGKDITTAFQIVTYDKHPPLFYALLFGWVRLAGKTEFSLRLLSAMFGTANIALMYSLGRQMFGHRVGLLVAAFIAVNPLHIWFSQEARMYQITVSFSLLSTLCLWRARGRGGWKNWFGYLVSTLLLTLTHYIAGLLIVGHAIFLFQDALRHRERWGVLRTWLLLLVAALLVSAPWLPYFVSQVQMDAGPPPWIATMLGSPSPADMVLTFLRDFTLGFPDMFSRLARWTAYLLAMGFIASAIYGTWVARDVVKGSQRDAMLLSGCALIVPVVTVWLLSQVWPAFVTRYLLAFSGYLYLILAWGVLRCPWRRLGVIAALCLLVMMAVCVGRLYGWPRERDWASIVTYVKEEWQDGDTLLIVPYANWVVFNYYAENSVPYDEDVYRQIWSSYPETPTHETLTQVFIDPSLSYQRLWWIDERGTGLSAEWGAADPNQTVEQFLDQHFTRIETPAELNSQWGRVTLYRLSVPTQ